jgi:hypothetical protein
MDLSGTMHTSDQNLLDVRCPAGASNKNYRPTLAGHPTPGDGVRFEDFLKRGYHLRPSVKGDVDRRSERRKLAALRDAAQYECAGFRQHKIHPRDSNRRLKALLLERFSFGRGRI